MYKIPIHTGHPYNVCGGSGTLSAAGELIKELRGSGTRIALITDTNVGPLYADTLEGSLKGAGFDTLSYTVPAGESSKNLRVYGEILEFLASNELTRSDMVAALGGGVIGDMAGFAAATYLRGVDMVSIPTSLLAAVDSSVGGKTAIDLKAGKNLAGAFHQPSLVILDTDTLDTLPQSELRDGMAEVVKYAILGDRDLFSHLKERGMGFDRDMVIGRSIEMKKALVEEDEFDRGKRKLLNFGHTLAHAAELMSKFTLSHGKAVAAGMSHMMRASAAMGLMDKEEALEAIALIDGLGLPTRFNYSVEELYSAMLKDKKRLGERISLIVPYAIGECRIEDMSLDDAYRFMELGAKG